MTELLAVFNKIFYLGYNRYLFVIQIFIAEILFMLPYKKQKINPIRLILAFILYLGVGLFLPESFGPIEIGAYITIPLFVFSVAIQKLASDYSLKKVIFNCSGAYALQSTVTNISICARRLLDISYENRLIVDIICTIVIYTIGYFLFARKSKKDDELNINEIKMMTIAIIVVLLADIMSKMATSQGIGSNVICRLSLSCSNILALIVQYNTYRIGKLEIENAKIEALLRAEQNQYKISKDTIDLVNMKCHDLKHQISRIRSEMQEGSQNDALKDMESAVMLYDNVAKTGNEALDSILTEKSLFCEKNHVELNYIADGKKIEIMSPSDIYSLVGNALDNAIECVIQETDEERRVIFMSVSGKNDLLNIHIENYCPRKISFGNDGLPLTSKADKQNHGIGVKSIRYIAEKYGGHAVFDYTNNLFTINVMIPLS